MAAVEIRETSAEQLDLLAPLWAALHAHHAKIGKDVAPMRDLDEYVELVGPVDRLPPG